MAIIHETYLPTSRYYFLEGKGNVSENVGNAYAKLIAPSPAYIRFILVL